MEHAIKRVEVIGLHNQFDTSVDLLPGLNIIYGKNGTGKTTFLHILANLLDRDIGRFGYIGFEKITVNTFSGDWVELRSEQGEAGPRTISVSVNGDLYAPVSAGASTPQNLGDALQRSLGGRPVYLPAFRSVLEAISGNRGTVNSAAEQSEEYRQIFELEQKGAEARQKRSGPRYYSLNDVPRAIAHKTVLCREWFGPFVPVVRFPSLWEVSEELLMELQDARLSVAAGDREAFSAVFVEVLRAILAPRDDVKQQNLSTLLERIKEQLAALEEIQDEVPWVYQEISSLLSGQRADPSKEEAIANRILAVYEQALSERYTAQQFAFRQIETFEGSVNKFLAGKVLSTRADGSWGLRRNRKPMLLSLADGRVAPLSVLSSGERHVLTLLFSATHMGASDGILLIDEPELSLHVGWQRMILDELMKQAGDRQIIACTHAPEVSAHHRDHMIRLSLNQSQRVQGDMFADDLDGGRS